MNRIAVFIDGTNLYSTSKALGFEIDYRRLLEWLRRDDPRAHVAYYVATLREEDTAYNPAQPLLDWMVYNGFQVVEKNAREYQGDAGQRRVKASICVDIAVDALAATWATTVVLVSGDGVYEPLLRALRQRGVWTRVVSSIATQPAFCADGLRRETDEFVDLKTLADRIARQK